MGQGMCLEEVTVVKTVDLLKETSMSPSDIAEQLGISRGIVLAINRRFKARDDDSNRN